ncbi:MAG TPA: PD-(D/E)XK nuclease family protein, partial [Pyrinomonadaceae bacterium]|nr:PD-(D/E)XK nuclease family protein [Pyrinomonadaceae bacterium]
DDLAAERGNQIISAAEFSRDVVDVLAHVKIPMHAETGGIRILLPNDIVGLQFERVFVIGMAEGILPAPSVDSNVIDFCERRRLRELGIYLEDALEVPRWEALTFYFTLLACKDRIVFSYPKFAGDSELLPSAFFKRLGVTPKQSGEKYISSVPEYRRAYLLKENQETNDEILTAARHQFEVESRRESDLPPDEYDGVIGIPVKRKTWSASSLSRIGSCAFKWFAHDILKLNEIKEGETDLRGDTRGRLMHKTLELAVKRVGQTVDLRSAILEILEEEFAKAEAEENEIGVISNWHLRRAEQIEKLRIAVASEHFVENGATIVSTEKRFEADFCGLTISGIVDRIDRLPDGKIVAVDYKSGTYIAKIKDNDGYLKIDIQLPIYSRIAAPKLFPDAECAGGQFFHLSTPKVTRGKETDLETFLTRVKSLLAQGNFAVDPDRKHDACKYCEYDIVCRTGPRLMPKRAR